MTAEPKVPTFADFLKAVAEPAKVPNWMIEHLNTKDDFAKEYIGVFIPTQSLVRDPDSAFGYRETSRDGRVRPDHIVGKRGDRIIMDDPFMPGSEEDRETRLRIFLDTAPLRIEHPKYLAVMLDQRLNCRCIADKRDFERNMRRMMSKRAFRRWRGKQRNRK